MDKNSKIYVAGHRGLVGSAIVRYLTSGGYENIIVRNRVELPLTSQNRVRDFFIANKPEYVFLAAAKVGGIRANMEMPAEFIYSNIQIQTNVINSSYECGVKKLLFLGSSCVYPKYAPQPIVEDSLLSGHLEPSNEAYAVAKIAGIVMCKSYNVQYKTDFISVMPTNLYGVNDNYDLDYSHVLPAMIRRFHEAKVNGHNNVTIWGTGSPLREFMCSDDLASACVMLMNNYSGNRIINIGSGEEVSTKGLAEIIKKIVGYEGEILFDETVPDGTPRKTIDSSRIKVMGWTCKIKLEDGIKIAYDDFLRRYNAGTN